MVWSKTGLLSLSLVRNKNFGYIGFSSKFGFKFGLKPKLKHHFMFQLNFGFKPVLVSNQGFKLWL